MSKFKVGDEVIITNILDDSDYSHFVGKLGTVVDYIAAVGIVYPYDVDIDGYTACFLEQELRKPTKLELVLK
jgi:hypothetical protein